MPTVQAAVFDAYGTLLDVHAAMQGLAARIVKHLEYSWVRSLAGPAQHRDFFSLTRDALQFVAAKHGVTDSALLTDVLKAYRRLTAYPEVAAMLAAFTGLRPTGWGCRRNG